MAIWRHDWITLVLLLYAGIFLHNNSWCPFGKAQSIVAGHREEHQRAVSLHQSISYWSSYHSSGHHSTIIWITAPISSIERYHITVVTILLGKDSCKIFVIMAYLDINLQLDSTWRKASEICLRPPLHIYFHTWSSPDNAQKPQIWPISAKGSP